MTFDELIAEVKSTGQKIDTNGIHFMAVQVNLKEGGVFYVEVKDGKVSVEPYEYNDRNCAITISQDNFLKLLNGKLDPVVGYTLRKIKVDGDIGKALEFSNLLKKARQE